MSLNILKLPVKIILIVIVPLTAIILLYNINSSSEKDTGSIWNNLTSLPFRINYKIPSTCQCDFTKNFRFVSSFIDSIRTARNSERDKLQY